MTHDSHESFRTTHWSVVREAANDQNPADARQALSSLCETYWPPLYAYTRRCGLSPSDAEDIVQGFFAHLLQRDDFAGLSPEKGRFRGFLLACLKHFLSNQRDRVGRRKRGGSVQLHSLDTQNLERRVASAASHRQTAEALFEKEWAIVLLQTVRDRLRNEQMDRDNPELTETLMGYLSGEALAPSYAITAERHGTSEAAIKMSVHRMRKRYRELLRNEIAHTVSEPTEIDDEIRYLISVFQHG